MRTLRLLLAIGRTNAGGSLPAAAPPAAAAAGAVPFLGRGWGLPGCGDGERECAAASPPASWDPALPCRWRAPASPGVPPLSRRRLPYLGEPGGRARARGRGPSLPLSFRCRVVSCRGAPPPGSPPAEAVLLRGPALPRPRPRPPKRLNGRGSCKATLRQNRYVHLHPQNLARRRRQEKMIGFPMVLQLSLRDDTVVCMHTLRQKKQNWKGS